MSPLFKKLNLSDQSETSATLLWLYQRKAFLTTDHWYDTDFLIGRSCQRGILEGNEMRPSWQLDRSLNLAPRGTATESFTAFSCQLDRSEARK